MEAGKKNGFIKHRRKRFPRLPGFRVSRSFKNHLLAVTRTLRSSAHVAVWGSWRTASPMCVPHSLQFSIFHSKRTCTCTHTPLARSFSRFLITVCDKMFVWWKSWSAVLSAVHCSLLRDVVLNYPIQFCLNLDIDHSWWVSEWNSSAALKCWDFCNQGATISFKYNFIH